jgi:hypothetical protein
MKILKSSPESNTAHRSNTKPVVSRVNDSKTITVRPRIPDSSESDTSSLEPAASHGSNSKNKAANMLNPEPVTSIPEPLATHTSNSEGIYSI